VGVHHFPAPFVHNLTYHPEGHFNFVSHFSAIFYLSNLTPYLQVTNPALRATFVKTATQLVSDYGFDGL
jgi:hypothetical protein